MTNLFDHFHHRSMYDECKAGAKFYPKQMSILDAYAQAAFYETGSKCHVESTRKFNNCPSFSKFSPFVACVINSFQIELQEFNAVNISCFRFFYRKTCHKKIHNISVLLFFQYCQPYFLARAKIVKYSLVVCQSSCWSWKSWWNIVSKHSLSLPATL